MYVYTAFQKDFKILPFRAGWIVYRATKTYFLLLSCFFCQELRNACEAALCKYFFLTAESRVALAIVQPSEPVRKQAYEYIHTLCLKSADRKCIFKLK
jgi:hypothetical protein